MKKNVKRFLSMAMILCMMVGMLTTGAGAFTYEGDGDDLGMLVQEITDEEGTYLYRVRLITEGSTVEFNEAVDVYTYGEDENGYFDPVLQEEDCTSFVIPDSKYTYIFMTEDSILLLRGAKSKQAPVNRVMSYEGRTLTLSKPILRMSSARLEETDYDTGEKYFVSYMVYEVPVGTEIRELFSEPASLWHFAEVWDSDGKRVDESEFDKIMTGMEPDGEMGACTEFPLTLDKAGYYVWIYPEVVASNYPIFKVVDEQPEEFVPAEVSFTDMNWSRDYVKKVCGYGWMDGMGGGKFQPGGNLTVAQAITLAARIHSVANMAPINPTEGVWYKTYVDYCLDNHLLYEDDELLMDLNRNITRAEVVWLLSLVYDFPYFDYNLYMSGNGISFSDVTPDDFAGEEIYTWAQLGLVTGDDRGFRPNDTITRGEMAVILCRLLGL